jgi:uncharacterized protein (DUF305 family)
MPSSRRRTVVPAVPAVVTVVALLALGACSVEPAPSASPSEASSSAADAGAPVVQLGAPGEDNRTLSPEEAGEVSAPEHTAADVAFVQAMLPHHGQALAMTALVEGRTASEQLPLLAERIELSQHDEIAQMENWLTTRGETVPDSGAQGGHAGHAGMPGMLTEAELARLGEAEGRRFDTMFLRFMVRHHEGAVQMVEELLSTGSSAQEPEIAQLVNHIQSDQLVEIARMRQMLVDGTY